jgi:RimJ/RimL family protein N-acetyltransferase
MVVNTASRRVMEKAGLEFERVFDGEWPISIPGDEHGDIRYSLGREEWKRRHATA